MELALLIVLVDHLKHFQGEFIALFQPGRTLAVLFSLFRFRRFRFRGHFRFTASLRALRGRLLRAT